MSKIVVTFTGMRGRKISKSFVMFRDACAFYMKMYEQGRAPEVKARNQSELLAFVNRTLQQSAKQEAL